MQQKIRTWTAILAAALMIPLAACGGKSNGQSANGDVAYPSSSTPVSASGDTLMPRDSTTPEHHSKIAGALVGAAAGHALGHHALAGAALGALVQHERNKHPRK